MYFEYLYIVCVTEYMVLIFMLFKKYFPAE